MPPAEAPIPPAAPTYKALIVDDEVSVKELLILALTKDVRLAIVGACGDETELRALLADNPPLDLVLSDCRIPGEDHIPLLTSYLAQQEHRAGMIAMSGLSPEEAWQSRRPSDLPVHVAYRYLRKAFNLRELKKLIDEMIAHIEGRGVISEREETRVEELPFTTSITAFSDFPSLMAALPVDPTKVIPQEGQLDSTVGLLSVSFDALFILVRGDAQNFQAEWDRCFPPNKRESLLRLISADPAAEFVLDCCWHDINGLLTASKFTGKNWEERERSKIQQHLAPAHSAFKRYSTTKYPAAFLMQQRIKADILKKEYTGVKIAGGIDRLIKGPAGALMSIFETFPSNAAKVGKGRPHMLEIELHERDGYTQAMIFDDLPQFNPGQLENLFDGRLESSGGWGTGLHRLAHLLQLMWEEGQNEVLPVESYHYRDGQWYRKVPGSAPSQVDATVIETICPTRPVSTTKFFILRFSHSERK